MLNLSFTDIFRYCMSLAPLFITCFLIMGSVLNQDVKGLVYLGGILIVAILTVGFKRLFRVRPPTDYNQEQCQVFNLPPLVTEFSAPDFNSMFLSFTTLYLLMPMAYGASQMNALLIIILIIFIIGNGATRYLTKCNNLMDILIGNLLGSGLGVGYFFAFWATNNKKLLFIDDLNSNNVVCNRPSKQTFKCAVYKNGQLIKNL